jgi:hypothetical protein
MSVSLLTDVDLRSRKTAQDRSCFDHARRPSPQAAARSAGPSAASTRRNRAACARAYGPG